MIDTQTSLAISMHESRGVYALLLGSGLSRAAQIPTGWEIVIDLIRRVALAEALDCGPDPAAWYEERYGEAPDYGVLLERLATTPAERSQIIRSYIEPSPEQRELGLRLPTEAHRAIARLVADGYVRVIVTTNFDRLLEAALGEVGVVPAVINSADAVLGTLPLAHNRCTIIKLHGDYVDARIKNTTVELGQYDEPMTRILEQVLREYGLVICGWSGEWDTALVDALERERSPWFPTYWVSYRQPRGNALRLIELRNAQLVANMDADAFFQRLADSVSALEDSTTPDTVSVAMARASIRRFIVDPSRRIQLHDLVLGEANRVRRRIENDPRTFYSEAPTQAEIANRLAHYESMTEVLRTLLATGCYWGEESHREEWVAAIERLADLPPVGGGNHYPDWERLRLYPALLALYSAGIAAVIRGRYDTLASVFYEPSVLIPNTQGRQTAFAILHPYLLAPRLAGMLESNSRISESALVRRLWLTPELWSALREYVPDDDRFRAFYDRFEYLAGLVHVDLREQIRAGTGWGPVGAIVWRSHYFNPQEFLTEINAEIQARGTDWPPLQGGLFGGSMDRLMTAKQNFDVRMLRTGLH